MSTMKKSAALLSLLALAWAGAALAQSTATPVQTGFLSTSGCQYAGQTACFIQYGPGFNASGQTTLTATTTTSNVALPSSGATVVVSNAGTTTAYVALGASTVTSTTATGTPVLAGSTVVLLATPAQTYIAGITATGSDVLTITTGTGVPAASPASGGSGGEPSTVNLAQVGGAAVLAGAGATGAGSQRTTVAQDSTTVAGSPSLPAGANVVGKVGIDQTTPGTTNNTTLDGAADNVAATAAVTSATNLFSVSTSGYTAVSIQFTSVGAGNIVTFEASNDGINWGAVFAYVQGANYSLSSTWVTANGTGFVIVNVAGYAQFRARVSTYGSGTIGVSYTMKRYMPFLNTPVGIGNGLTIQGGAGNPVTVSGNVGNVAAGTSITAASGNVANASAVATLAGTSGKTTYITGFQCTASGSTIGLAVNLTVAGVITGTMTYTFVFTAGVLTEAPSLTVSFPNPVPASAANTAIVVTNPAGGTGNTNSACNAQGFQL